MQSRLGTVLLGFALLAVAACSQLTEPNGPRDLHDGMFGGRYGDIGGGR